MNVFQLVKRMRQSHPYSVRTFKHYLLIYEALFEEFQAGDTILGKDLRKRYRNLCQTNPLSGTSYLVDQYKMLEQFTPTLSKKACSDAFKAENRRKNADQNIVPPDWHRPVLNTTADINPPCGYINAVFVDGLNRKSEFIVTQAPLNNTVFDFWRMVFDYQVQTIVMLGQCKGMNVEPYFPRTGSRQFQYITVEHVTTAHAGVVTVRNLKICVFTSGGVEKMVIRHFHVECWAEDDSSLECYRLESLPDSKTNLLTLIDKVMDWQMLANRRTRPIVVVDKNGASISGVFCACALLCERMRVNGEVDLYHTVKHMKRRRPQFISSFEQYRYLHHVLWEYLNVYIFTQKARYDDNDDDDDDDYYEHGYNDDVEYGEDIKESSDDPVGYIWSCSAENSFDEYNRFPLTGEGAATDVVATLGDNTAEKGNDGVQGVQEVSMAKPPEEKDLSKLKCRDLYERGFPCTSTARAKCPEYDRPPPCASSQYIPRCPPERIVSKGLRENECRGGRSERCKKYYRDVDDRDPCSRYLKRRDSDLRSCSDRRCSSICVDNDSAGKCSRLSSASGLLRQGMFETYIPQSKCRPDSAKSSRNSRQNLSCGCLDDDGRVKKTESTVNPGLETLRRAYFACADGEIGREQPKETWRTPSQGGSAAELSRKYSAIAKTQGISEKGPAVSNVQELSRKPSPSADTRTMSRKPFSADKKVEIQRNSISTLSRRESSETSSSAGREKDFPITNSDKSRKRSMSKCQDERKIMSRACDDVTGTSAGCQQQEDTEQSSVTTSEYDVVMDTQHFSRKK
ncbi:hypothetical protein EGW08_015625 [Elysia chlorotica]|uniref:protein-tyrosine-phosphatase n=1 Tax=Elysia chlorotica TaxID=188477 RepID=A0A3S1HCL2_ELYCH|nr:hypothetical protein EGW08_015625 [Elysia chlorotica]